MTAPGLWSTLFSYNRHQGGTARRKTADLCAQGEAGVGDHREATLNQVVAASVRAAERALGRAGIGPAVPVSYVRHGASRLWSRCVALVRLARPVETSAVALGAVVGARLAATDLRMWTILGVVAVNALLYAASLTINDASDVAEDSINRPDRPIPSGAIGAGAALLAGSTLFVAGLALATAIDPRLGAGAAGVSLLSALYSARLKGVPLLGNVVVSLCCTFPLLCWLLVGGEASGSFFALVAAVLVGRAGCELIKCADDERGDRASRVRTVATVLGAPAAIHLGCALLAVGLLVCMVPTILGETNPLFSLALGAAITVLAWGWWPHHSGRSRTRASGRLVPLERLIQVLVSIGFLIGYTGPPSL